MELILACSDQHCNYWLILEKSTPYTIKYKYSIQSEVFMELVVSTEYGRRKSIGSLIVQQLYKSRVPISEEDRHDLINLLSRRVIPAEYQAYYEGLPSSRRVAAIVDEDGE